jgi:hypothetical protein
MESTIGRAARRRALGWLVAALVGAAAVHAAPTPASPAPPVDQRLLARYTDLLNALRADIAKVVPRADEQKKAAFQKARDALKKADADARAAQQRLGAVQTAKALVEHAKGKWIGGAEKGIAQAQEALKKAATDAERDAARKELAKWQANKEDGLKALKERQTAYDKAKVDEPKLTEANQAAQAALTQARAAELEAAKALLADVDAFLVSDKLDAQLVKCAVLANATPQGLALFAQQGKEQEALIDALLADQALMKEMLVAGGANQGRYGQAMAIYTAIRKASQQAATGLFQRLALAVSLEHAVPIAQSNPSDQTDAPATVDPVKRYQHFEKACLDGELDPVFKGLTAWELRNAVNGDETDEALAWGREMLRNYRPDHILNPDFGWRYSGAVRTDVKYGSQDVKNDRPTLQKYQNIILNGGVCGRRAFFGRFILRCFGIPTVARPQPGHAALVHWTPAGWVINLGAGWGSGSVAGAPDTDFLLETQARRYPQEYLKVQRAQWVGDALGEQPVNAAKDGSGGWWHNVALYQKKTIVATAKPAQLAALGQELGEANESAAAKAAALAKVTVTEADKQVVTGPDGVITIPAAACGGSAQPVKSVLGGLQAVCGGGPFQCSVEAPKAGKYALTARVVTVHGEMPLQLTVNNAKQPVAVLLPYTIGKWQRSAPVEVSLAQGKNTLSFAQPTANFTLKDLTLTPVK